MVIKKIALPRRTFIRGVGAALALPLLDAMVPAFTPIVRTAANPPPRFGAVFVPNGAIVDQWIPAAPGTGFELTPILKPLERFQSSLVVVSNLTRANPGVVEGDHAISASGWLTGVYPKRTEAEDIRAGITIDQIIAKQIGQETPFPSLELATTDYTGYIGACTSGFSCAYTNTISWSSPTTPLPMEINPRVLFERMFGRPGTPAERRARAERKISILDLIAKETGQLQRGLGARDRARLGEYLDNIREIERRIERTEAHNSTEVTSVALPVGIPEAFEDHLALMYDLMTIAYQTDLTRVVTFMTDRELSQRTYPQIGVTEQHHTVSHHGNDPENIAKVARINTYHVELFAKFLDRMRATPDGDGSLLDHSLIFYGGGMGNPNQHASDPLPLIAVGGGVGTGHRHLALPTRTPIGNLWMAVAQHYGSPIDHVGDSNGAVELF
ncbi:MAG: DUF1552 domain-containing protein [Acidobacteriota bacterium]